VCYWVQSGQRPQARDGNHYSNTSDTHRRQPFDWGDLAVWLWSGWTESDWAGAPGTEQ